MREKLIELLKKTPIAEINGHIAKAEVCFMPHVLASMAHHLIANGVTVQQWIPVTERLPEPYTQVITLRTYLLSGDSYPVGLEYIRLHGDANIPVWSRDYATWKNKVTHWMPLPQPPKEG